MEIRRYQEGEGREIWALFYDTVHKVNSKDYSTRQIMAWAPLRSAATAWNERLKQKCPIVAVHEGRIVGFAELENNGHIDYFYCAHDFQRKGVGTALLSTIEEEAKQLGVRELFTEASITAVEFFKSRGFEVSRKQIVEHNGEKFTNYAMFKIINR